MDCAGAAKVKSPSALLSGRDQAHKVMMLMALHIEMRLRAINNLSALCYSSYVYTVNRRWANPNLSASKLITRNDMKVTEL